ncbi:MAG: lysylphosphatidylglycerol synthase transmembrane domain-containing protein [archaeon]
MKLRASGRKGKTARSSGIGLFKKIHFLGILAIFAAILAATILLNDRELLFAAVKKFPFYTFPLLLIPTALSIVLRAFRWLLLLEEKERPQEFKKTIQIILASSAISLVTPARAGELARCFFLRNVSRTPFRKSIFSLIFERLFDFSILLFLSVQGVFLLKQGTTALAFGTFLIGGVVAATGISLTIPPFSTFLFRKILRDKGKRMERAVQATIRRPGFFLAAALSTAIWTVEFSRFYFVLFLLGAGTQGFFQVAQILSISIIAGVVSTVPGGLGTSDLSAVALFSLVGVPVHQVSVALIIDRLAGFWPVVFSGILVAPDLTKKNPTK